MAQARDRWPQIRGILVALHVTSVLVLSLPSANTLVNRRGWETPNAKAEMRHWARRLRTIGYERTPEQFEGELWSVAKGFATFRERIAVPFQFYGNLTGARQGWQMFASPQKYPAELHLDVRTGGEWKALVRPRDDRSGWRLRQRTHNRMRKQLGRFARTFYRDRYEGLARWFATQAARDFPEVDAVRVRLWRYHSLPPKRSSQGEIPDGHYEHELVFPAQELR